MGGLEVAIHQRDSREESLVGAGEVREYFDDPVDHASSDRWRDVVTSKALACVKFQLLLSQISLNIVGELRSHIYILTLNIACLNARQMPTWMLWGLIIVFHHLIFFNSRNLVATRIHRR